MEVAGTNIPSLWDKHPGVLGDAKLFMVRTLLNKRHTLHFRCDSRKKTVPPYFHIHVPMYIYICLYEQNWRLWQCHGGYVHQLGFHVCFISATGSHLRWCLRLEKPIPLYIYIRPICLGYIREYPPQTMSFFGQKNGIEIPRWSAHPAVFADSVASGEWLLWWFDGRFCRDLEAWRWAPMNFFPKSPNELAGVE